MRQCGKCLRGSPWHPPHKCQLSSRRDECDYFVYCAGDGSEAQRRPEACHGHSARQQSSRAGFPKADPVAGSPDQGSAGTGKGWGGSRASCKPRPCPTVGGLFLTLQGSSEMSLMPQSGLVRSKDAASVTFLLLRTAWPRLPWRDAISQALPAAMWSFGHSGPKAVLRGSHRGLQLEAEAPTALPGWDRARCA